MEQLNPVVRERYLHAVRRNYDLRERISEFNREMEELCAMIGVSNTEIAAALRARVAIYVNGLLTRVLNTETLIAEFSRSVPVQELVQGERTTQVYNLLMRFQDNRSVPRPFTMDQQLDMLRNIDESFFATLTLSTNLSVLETTSSISLETLREISQLPVQLDYEHVVRGWKNIISRGLNLAINADVLLFETGFSDTGPQEDLPRRTFTITEIEESADQPLVRSQPINIPSQNRGDLNTLQGTFASSPIG